MDLTHSLSQITPALDGKKVRVAGWVHEKRDMGKVPADIDVRLDSRSVDLRRLETQATFKIRGELQKAFREKALELEFQEINTPTLLESASEGGTDVFEVKYFEKKAFQI